MCPLIASYTYDPLSRRTGAAHGNGTSVSPSISTGIDLLTLANNFVGSSVTHTNTYTPAHRLNEETVSNAVWRFAPAAVETTTYAAANNLNQYIQVTKGANPTVTLGYDASGNLTGDGTWTFAYDAENKMTSATKSGTAATYAYDPLLRRQGKTVNGVTTTFLLDGAEEIGEYDGAGAMLRRYVPSSGTDAPIAMIEGTGGSTVRTWFHRNRLGSTIAMSNGAGAVSEGPITYDPFGNSASTGGVPFKYTGRRLDPETGLYYYRARYYSPALGRFLQTDPIGTCDNMNLYAYVDNDPVNKADPTGLAEEPGTGGWDCTPPGSSGSTTCAKRRDRGAERRLESTKDTLAAFFKFFAMRAIPSYDGIDPDGARGSLDEEPLAYFPGQTAITVDQAVKKMLRERDEMVRRSWIGNDKYHHCKANCEATRLGPVGLAVAIIGSLYREITQGGADIANGRYHPGDAAADMAANEQGRKGALEQPNKSCQDICSNLAPPGYLGD